MGGPDLDEEALALAKYEALGNDFLVLVDPTGTARFDAALAVAVCDRHRGVGADGLLHLSASDHPGTVQMALRNADGGAAETSGNGLRCAALAALDAGLVDTEELEIETVAGRSHAVVSRSGHPEAGDGRAVAWVTVTMGELTVEEVASPLAGRRAFRVDAGNPHLVVVGDGFEGVDLAALGARIDGATPSGTNVELVTPRRDPQGASMSEDVAIEMAVWERGVGLTLACGSGSAAAAAAARFAGRAGGAGERIAVENPGGTLFIDLEGGDPARPTATLTGPARRVASVRVRVEDLLDGSGATA